MSCPLRKDRTGHEEYLKNEDNHKNEDDLNKHKICA